MEIKPVATFRSPMTEKFGIPRQSGLAPALRGQVVLEPGYDAPEILRGLEVFDYLWLIWGFDTGSWSCTVRPPRLGGNRRIGVFASRSPFRPNPLALSSVRIEKVEPGVIHVSGADLMDGTLIYDIKPYVEYADSHPGVRSGFVDTYGWQPLEVDIPDGLAEGLDEDDILALTQVLAQDPRPRYQDDPEREYGMEFAGRNVRFRVIAGVLTVCSISTPDGSGDSQI